VRFCVAVVSHSSRRAVIATAAPACPNPLAISRPIPRDPPVTSATLPDRSKRSLTCIGWGALLYAPRSSPPRPQYNVGRTLLTREAVVLTCCEANPCGDGRYVAPDRARRLWGSARL